MYKQEEACNVKTVEEINAEEIIKKSINYMLNKLPGGAGNARLFPAVLRTPSAFSISRRAYHAAQPAQLLPPWGRQVFSASVSPKNPACVRSSRSTSPRVSSTGKYCRAR